MNRSISFFIVIILLLTSFTSIAQVKISQMPETTQNPTGGWIPIVIGTTNNKINAGVFYNTIPQKTITELRAISITTLPNNFTYFITDENKQGLFRYDNADVTSTDDGAMVLVSTDNKRFKRIVQDNVINAKWFGAVGAGVDATISSLGLTFAQAQQIFDRSGSRIVLTLTDFNTQSVDWFAIQRAINYCISSSNGKLYIPAGNYYLKKGLVVAPKAGAGFVTSFEIEGATTTYDGPRQTVLTIANNNSFGIGLQFCKGARIKNLFLAGQNDLTTLNNYDILENPNTNWTNGCRNNTVSPHAGIVVDPFFNYIANSDPEKYPDFIDLYPSATEFSGGSTDVIVDNCRIEKFVVGISFSPHDAPQNGDAMAVNNSWIKFCKSAISIGQSQNRSVYVNNLKVWLGVETVFDSSQYGDGRGDNVEVDGLDVVGVRYLTRLSGYFNKGLIIKRMHAEVLHSLGGNFAGTSGDLFIENSFVHLQPSYNLGAVGPVAVHRATSIFKGGTLKVSDSFLGTYSGTDNTPLQFNARLGIFEKCLFEYLPVNTNLNRVTFKNCEGAGSNYHFGDGEIFNLNYPNEIFNQYFLFASNMEWHMAPNYKRKQIIGNPYVSISLNLTSPDGLTNGVKLTNIDVNNFTATAIISPTSNNYKIIQVGDNIYSYSTSIPNEYGDGGSFFLGNVIAKDNATGTITFGHTARGIDNTTVFPIAIIRPQFLLPPLILGNITAGSNVVVNCEAEALAPVLGIPVGITITSPYFPLGTYIVSSTSNTVTLSNSATTSAQGAEIIGANWQGEEYGIISSRYYNPGYKRGDIVYNTDFVNYPEIEKWTCSKSGITGSVNYPPKFEISFKNSSKTFTVPSGGTINIDGGRFVSSIIVKPVAALTGFKVGTTSGGSDVVASIAVAAGADKVFLINRYFRTSTTLFFSWTSPASVSVEVIVPK
jgi:hypothetical protein